MKLEVIEEFAQARTDQKCAVADNGMVATAFPEATQAGVSMLEAGGNAIDAACAAAVAIGVCEPQGSGIGGQSMAIMHFKGQTIAIDGSSRAPSLAHLNKFKPGDFKLGYRAATVPTTLAVLGHLNFRYGNLKWSQILEPAIRIAREGYKITALQHNLLRREQDKFASIPSRSGMDYFYRDDHTPYLVDECFKQKVLARTLEYIADHGPRAFYRGKIAHQIDRDMRTNNGFLRADDLALIPWPVERKPLHRRYRHIQVYTLPPPAAGRTLLLVLLMLNNLPVKFIRSNSPESYHIIAEIFRKAFLQRTQRPYDPNTYPQQSNKLMLSRNFAKQQVMGIQASIDPALPLIEPPLRDADTTHISVMDAVGNAIGITQSIELAYGSKAAARNLGFLYNNYMHAFETENPAHPHYLRPNASPWTQVAPAIVFIGDKPWLTMGSPGSERIYSTLSQFLYRMVDMNMSMSAAMLAPRFHCSIGGRLSLEADRFSPDLVRYLDQMGYNLDQKEDYSFYLGAVHAVLKCQSRTGFVGVAEYRRDGIAKGV